MKTSKTGPRGNCDANCWPCSQKALRGILSPTRVHARRCYFKPMSSVCRLLFFCTQKNSSCFLKTFFFLPNQHCITPSQNFRACPVSRHCVTLWETREIKSDRDLDVWKRANKRRTSRCKHNASSDTRAERHQSARKRPSSVFDPQ